MAVYQIRLKVIEGSVQQRRVNLLPSPTERVPEGLNRVQASVYGGNRVRNTCGNPYLSKGITKESEVADTRGSTATTSSALMNFQMHMDTMPS
jgi:hypothetical protein